LDVGCAPAKAQACRTMPEDAQPALQAGIDAQAVTAIVG
jgi:hypothetical protein